MSQPGFWDNPEKAQGTVAELKAVNEQLWDIEDDIRLKEKAQAFDQGFVDLARSVYLRMRNAGFTELTCFPMLSSFDQIGGPFWSYLESRVVSRLTPDEAGAFLGAMAQAREAGVLFCCAPHHCVVGRKPV